MTTRIIVTLSGLLAVVGFLAGSATVVAAQQTGNTNKPSTGKPMALHGSAGQKTSSHKTPKRAARKPQAGAAQQTIQSPVQREWSLEDAMPTRQTNPTTVRETPAISTPQLGRIPLESGTFGFETQTRVKSGELYDGRRAPGLETVKRDPPSYFGLSLSVPTTNKSLIPPPLAPPWGRD